MSSLRIQLLGNFCLHENDEPVTAISQHRQQELLAYLLIRCRTPQPRRQVAFALWPETSDQQALTNLRREIYHLRRALPAAKTYLAINSRTIAWRTDAPYELDVGAFEEQIARAQEAAKQGHVDVEQKHLTQCVDVHNGTLLPDFYEPWILEERERLDTQYVWALDRLSTLLTEQDDHSGAIRYVEQLLRHDRFREATYRRLIQLHLANGDQVQALHAYHACATMLKEELGVKPSAATQALRNQLVDPAAPQSTAPAPRVDREPATVPSHTPRSKLIGRAAEWQTLRQAWRSAQAGIAHFVVVAGEPGIGKSRLAEDLLAWVNQQGHATAYARSYDAEGDLAYEPITEMLRCEAVSSRLSSLDVLWLMELVRLLPELQSDHPELPIPRRLSEGWQRRRFHEALSRAFLSSGEPLLLVLDDLQWCDRETLEFLPYLLRFDQQSPLLIVGTVRPGEVGPEHPLIALLHQLRHRGQATEITLRRLDIKDTGQLAQQLMGQPLSAGVVQHLYQLTEGNPLFVKETLRAQEDLQQKADDSSDTLLHTVDISPKVQAVIAARLNRLSQNARRLAELAATIGRHFSYQVLHRASDEDERSVATALDELWQRQIIREQSVNRYDFSHDRIREVTYMEIPPAQRRLMHRRVARALLDIGQADLSTMSAQVAAHFRQAGELLKAARYYEQAAVTARNVLAYDEVIAAAQHGIAALESAPHSTDKFKLEINLQIILGEALAATICQTAAGAGRAYERARQLCMELDDFTQYTRIQSDLMSYYGNRSDWDHIRSLAERDTELAETLDDTNMLKQATGSLGWAAFARGKFLNASEHLLRAQHLNALEPTPPDSVFFGHDFIGSSFLMCADWMLGDLRAAQNHREELMAAARSSPHIYDLVTSGELVTVFHHWCRDFDAMRSQASEVLQVAEQYGYSLYQRVGQILVARSTAEFAAYDSRKGRDQLEELRQQIDAMMDEELYLFVPYYLSVLAELYAKHAMLPAAVEALNDALSITQETGESFWDAEIYRLRGVFLQQQESTRHEAREDLQRSLAIAQQQQARSLELRTLITLCRLNQGQDEETELLTTLAQLYSKFPKDFDAPDLRQAQALLATLN